MDETETLQAEIESETAVLTWRRKVDLPQVRRRIQEHIAEMGREGQYMRLLALLDQLMEAEEDLFWRFKRYEANAAAGRPYAERAIIAAFIPEHERRVEKMRREIDYLQGALFKPARAKHDRVTPEMVERAKTYPLENLVEVRRGGMALCLWHDDHNPSMLIKNGFAHCFSCHKTADAISVYQKIHGATFPEAVEALQ